MKHRDFHISSSSAAPAESEQSPLEKAKQLLTARSIFYDCNYHFIFSKSLRRIESSAETAFELPISSLRGRASSCKI